MTTMTRARRKPGLILLAVLFTCGYAQAGEYLGDMSWPEAKERLKTAPVVILPFAAGAKEHGHHLPMNADRKLMEHLVSVAVTNTDAIAAPPILYGWFPAFREFPGTEVEDAHIFERYVFHAAASLVRSGAKRIVFLNTGVAKATGLPISISAREIRARCDTPTLVISWDDLETREVNAFIEQQWGGHADESETAVNLVLQPDEVDMDKATSEMGAPPKSYPGYRPGGFSQDPDHPAYSAAGIRGDPSLATAEKGQKVLDVMEKNWLAALHGFGREPQGKLDSDCR